MPVISTGPEGRIVVTVQQRGARTVVHDRQKLRVVSRGPQGPKGDTGASLPPVSFAYGDSSPVLVFTLAVDTEIIVASLQIFTAFNGSGASLRLGTVASPGCLLDTSQNDPTAVGVYKTNPHVNLVAGTAVKITIVPGGGATQGSGQVVLEAASP
jgi:hypothetical protein